MKELFNNIKEVEIEEEEILIEEPIISPIPEIWRINYPHPQSPPAKA